VSARAGLAALCVAASLGGCGGSGEDETTTTAPPATPPPHETVDKLPKLPQSWHPYVQRRGGFAVGLPRGWTAKANGDNALVRSYDHLVAISIVPNRSAAAQEVSLPDFANRAAEALPGLRGDLRRVQARAYRHRYDGAEVRARATAAGGIDQRLEVIALRRDSIVTVTAVIAANAIPAARASRRLARHVVGTLSTRPPRRAGGG
jgi:hypothetical protein